MYRAELEATRRRNSEKLEEVAPLTAQNCLPENSFMVGQYERIMKRTAGVRRCSIT